MKQKKYSEAKIKSSKEFLSKYNLTFDALDEEQKLAVVRYSYPKKILWLATLSLLVGFIACSVMVYLHYTKTYTSIENTAELIPFMKENSKSSFIDGFFVGTQTFAAIMFFIYIITIPFTLKWRWQVLNAFLPIIKQSANHEQTPSN